MIVHTNIEKYTIFYPIKREPQICTINKRLVLMPCFFTWSNPQKFRGNRESNIPYLSAFPICSVLLFLN